MRFKIELAVNHQFMAVASDEENPGMEAAGGGQTPDLAMLALIKILWGDVKIHNERMEKMAKEMLDLKEANKASYEPVRGFLLNGVQLYRRVDSESDD